jgi:hypothetical protein
VHIARPAAPIAEMKDYGAPSKPFFIIGAIGMLILLIAAQVPWIFFWTFMWIWMFYLMVTIELFSFISMAIGASIASFAFLGFYRNYRSAMGLATFIITFIFAWWVPVGYIMQLYYPWMILTSVWVMLVGIILIGVMLILWGSAFLTIKGYAVRGPSKAAGIIFIVSGSFWCSLIFSYAFIPVGSILLIPACILAIITLFMAKTSSDA